MSLIYRLDPMVTKIYDYVMMSLGSNGCFVTGRPCLNGGYGYGFASSMGHPWSDLVRLLVYDGMRKISRGHRCYMYVYIYAYHVFSALKY
jgi:hypothetical protein